MEKELLKKAFDVLKDEFKVIEILSELHLDAVNIFKKLLLQSIILLFASE